MIKCDICIRDVAPFRKYCRRCRRLVYRAGNKMAHVLALKRDYDETLDVFRCHYIRIILEENDPKSPKYLTFDHLVPGVKDKENVVLTFAVLNEAKTDMDWEEYVALSREVGNAHDGGAFDERVLELKHWYRVVRPGMGRRGRNRRG